MTFQKELVSKTMSKMLTIFRHKNESKIDVKFDVKIESKKLSKLKVQKMGPKSESKNGGPKKGVQKMSPKLEVQKWVQKWGSGQIYTGFQKISVPAFRESILLAFGHIQTDPRYEYICIYIYCKRKHLKCLL